MLMPTSTVIMWRRYACRYYVAAHTLYLLQKTMAMALLTCWRGVFAQPVEHVRMARPVGDEAPSGTLIRSDVHRYRYMLANDVYYSFVRRICLLGGESTGKSTLSKALAGVLDTVYVAEFGRDYWEEKNGIFNCG